jgi:hypothetical protein
MRPGREREPFEGSACRKAICAPSSIACPSMPAARAASKHPGCRTNCRRRNATPCGWAGRIRTAAASGQGVLLSGFRGVLLLKAVAFRGAAIGTYAARRAAGLPSDVVVLDRSPLRPCGRDELFVGLFSRTSKPGVCRTRCGPGRRHRRRSRLRCRRSQVGHARQARARETRSGRGRCGRRSSRLLGDFGPTCALPLGW